MNKTLNFLFMCFLCSFVFSNLTAQENYLFKAEFSIKEKKKGAEKGSLIMGEVLYDTKKNHSAYRIRFPEKERWVVLDTLMYRVLNDSIKKRDTIPSLGEYSFFYIILNQELTDFGLQKAGYKPGEVWTEEGKVLSKWIPPTHLSDYMKPVILMQENKLLTGIVFFDNDENQIGRFYFKDYEVISGIPVPKKIYQIYTLPDNEEIIKLMTFKNIKINETSDNLADYFYLPGTEK